MKLPAISASVIVSILVTGAFLNVMGSGMLGDAPKKFAQFITKGYGSV